MKKLVLLCTCIAIALLSQGQDNNFNQTPVTIATPDAAQFVRYGNIPMDYSTGVPNISIPLYTVTCGKLSLPIDLSYHAGGIKVADIASTVGLGWTLNAGGLVTKTTLGTDDHIGNPKPFLSAGDVAAGVNQCLNNSSNVNNFTTTVNQVFQGFNESQSDRYFYDFNGRSGIFRPDFNTGVLKTIPYSALQITMEPGFSAPYKITAEDGTKYYFAQQEISNTLSTLTYYLTKIESADSTHVINISYKQESGAVGQFIKNYVLQYTRDVSTQGGVQDVILTQTQNYEFVTETVPELIDNITSDNEVIHFQYSADRPDPRKSRLVSMTILNRVSGETIKVIQFQQSYFGTAADNNQRLRLDNLLFKDGTNATVQQYGFGYNSMALPPYYHQLGWSEHHNVDYWGFYNGSDNPNLLPRELFDFPGSPFTANDKSFYGGDRNPNPNYAQACILNQITYPTGGTTNFVYELNQVDDGYSYTPTPIHDFGGLRVKTITSTPDASSTPLIKTYKYLEPIYTRITPDVFGYSMVWTRFGPSTIPTQNPTGNVTGYTICTDPLISLSTGSGPIVIYNDVIEYDGTETNNNGYVERNYGNTSIPYYIYDPTTMGNVYLNGYYKTDFGLFKPLLWSETYFGKDQSNANKAIKTVNYTYTNFNSGTFRTGVFLQRNHPYRKTGDFAPMTDAQAFCAYVVGCGTQLQQLALDIEYSDLLGVLTVPLVTEKVETIQPLNGSGSLVSTTDYTYNLVTLEPIEEDVVNSKGETFKKKSTYPVDYPSIEPYATMVSRNILNPIIEQFVFKDNSTSPIQSTRTNYSFWTGTAWSNSANNIIVPQTVETKTDPQTSYETRFRYTSYDDRGNVTTVAKENDLLKTYLWGYNKNYPVAEITGTDYATASSYITQSILDRPYDDATLRTHLNNLRGIPGALVNTYTYRPLVGMTSATDINGRTTYYNYDAFGRLDHIKDKDGNIVKKFCYNYLGQPGNCSIYGNVVQSNIFIKNDCAPGYSGSPVTYTVPANTYFASNQTDANNLALNALNGNGQAYANANGTCSISTATVYGNSFVNYPYTVQFTNVSTNQVYYMQLSEDGSATAQMPPGTYNISIYPSSSSWTNTSFNVNGFSSFGSGANFYSISIYDGSYVEIGD